MVVLAAIICQHVWDAAKRSRLEHCPALNVKARKEGRRAVASLTQKGKVRSSDTYAIPN